MVSSGRTDIKKTLQYSSSVNILQMKLGLPMPRHMRRDIATHARLLTLCILEAEQPPAPSGYHERKGENKKFDLPFFQGHVGIMPMPPPPEPPPRRERFPEVPPPLLPLVAFFFISPADSLSANEPPEDFRPAFELPPRKPPRDRFWGPLRILLSRGI